MGYVTGIDVSKWQGDMDWQRAKVKAGILFAYIKATDGAAGVDYRFLDNWRETKEVGLIRGAYHFFKADKDPRKQAQLFAKMCEGGDLPPVVDIEQRPILVKKTAMEGAVVKFLREFERLTGRKCMIYTSPGFWNSNLPRTDWAKHYPLWVANWTTRAAPTLPFDWGLRKATWTFWQYSAKGPGATYGAQSKSIDLDRFCGSVEDLLKLAG